LCKEYIKGYSLRVFPCILDSIYIKGYSLRVFPCILDSKYIKGFILRVCPCILDSKYIKRYSLTVCPHILDSKYIKRYSLRVCPCILDSKYIKGYSLRVERAADQFAASQEIPHISRNLKVHHRTHKRPPPVSILGQPNPVHIPTFCIFMIIHSIQNVKQCNY
jgi:hypothetical protein